MQWVATVARPDVARPVNLISQYVSEKVTWRRAACARRVLRYLLGTKDSGLVYTTRGERHFQAEYEELASVGKGGSPNKRFPKLHLFSDASFASCPRTRKSVSGAVLFNRSVPILWRSRRQAVLTHSTMESEWVAASDAIALITWGGAPRFFLTGRLKRGWGVKRRFLTTCCCGWTTSRP